MNWLYSIPYNESDRINEESNWMQRGRMHGCEEKADFVEKLLILRKQTKNRLDSGNLSKPFQQRNSF